MKKSKALLVLFYIILFTSQSFAQRGKDGSVTINTANKIVNEYTRLTADASVGATSITVAASGLNTNSRFGAALAPGDLIMIIQMQGASMAGTSVEWPTGSGIFLGFPDDNTSGGITAYNNCGNYEFCEVNAVPSGTTITLDCGLINNYTAAGRVQVIRVPRYSSLTITSPGSITGTAWGAAYIGGVIAIEVANNTVINAGASITGTGIGFRGAALAANNAGGYGGGQVSSTNFAEGSNKGEGIGGYQADYNVIGGQYARGAGANAGGGGDCHNSGGGGGANGGSLVGWDGLGNPDVSGGAGWVSAWNLEVAGFSAHTSPGGGKGGYSFGASNQNATTTAPNLTAWGGDNRRSNGGLGGRPLDYSTGKLFLGGGGGAGDMDNNAGGVGGPGGGLIYIMNYGTLSGTGTIISSGNSGGNSGIDGGGGAGGGGTIILNSVGTISGITATANGGVGGNQVVPGGTNESEGPGGGGGGGYIAISNGVITQNVNGGANGTTNSAGVTEFPPNGATKGAAGTANQTIPHDTITVTPVTICVGNTATLTASIVGPIGATIYWYSAITGGAPIATGPTFTTPVLAVTTTYYVGFCPGTYRKPVVVTVTGAAIVTSAITGPTPICPNAIGVVYSVTNTVGSTYAWTVPAGATITSGQGTNQITVNFGATGGTISVTETNSCGTGTPVNFAVAVSAVPVTSAITGTTPVCPNATGVIYSVTNVAGSTYAWTVPAGATITSGAGTNQITVNFGATGGNISVVQTSACGVAAAVNFAVAISPLPVTSAITGTTPVCPNAAGITYSVTNVAGNTYAWTVPAGATITAGAGTNQITVTWGATGGNISVVQSNACGAGAAVNFAVAITPLPVTSAITGTTPVCANATGITYSVTNVAGNTYAWTVPAGATITAGAGTNQITVNWGATGGNVSVVQTNACGSGAAVTLAVAITPLPVTSAITGTTPVCPNAAGVTYLVTNVVGNTYAWTVPAGATITAGAGTNQITVTWGATAGNVSVVQTNACGSGAAVNFPVAITPLPVTSAITGTSPVCPNAVGITYSVANVAGNTYAWTVPAGATITAGAGTNQITVNWGATGGNVSVIQSNVCGSGAAVTMPVAISALPVTSVITGTSPVCPNAVGITYSVVNTPGSTYAWTVPAGATITGGAGTNQITVSFGATGGNISVIETGTCGVGAAVNFAVAISPLPVTSAITGTSPVCPNATGITYSVTNTVGSTYAWTVPAGATITSGQGTNQITVDFGATGGTISVIETNTCGSGASVNLAVAISAIPVTSAITGTTPVCPNAVGVTYSVVNTAGSTYAWTVPAGATITSGAGTNQITVNFGATGGTISVTETSTCGVGAAVTLNVTIAPLPVTSAITGTTPVCENATGIIYSVINTAGSTYTWTVPAGATITSGQGTNQITVDWTSTGGNISVTETNSCGSGTPVTFAVAITPLPVTSAITGPSPVCPNATGITYSVINTAGSAYVWTVPAGATITSGQGTNQITVDFGATGGTISVVESSICGVGTAVTLAVATSSLPVTSAITGTSPVCANATGITFSVVNTTGSTYAWTVPAGATITAGAGTNQITVDFGATGGTISVTETATCGVGTPVNFTVVTTALPVTSAITGTSPVCPSATGILYSVTNTAGSTYAWTVPTGATITSGAGTNQITVDFGATGGTISVTETASCGTGTAVTYAVVVSTPAAPTVTSPVTYCQNAVATPLTATGTNLLWYTVAAGGTSSATPPTPLTTVAGSTDYYVSQTVTGCESPRATIMVTVNPIPTVTVNSTVICSGIAATLTAGGATSYTWSAGATSTGVNTATATPAATTSYTVTGTTGGCSATAVSTVTVNTPPTVSITNVTICAGQTATLTVVGTGTSYVWNTGATTVSINVSPSTTTSYTVTANPTACSNSTIGTVNVLPVPVVTVNSQSICSGQSATLTASGATSYVWNTGSTSSSVTISPSSTSTYTVTGTSGTCSSTASASVAVNPMPVANFTAPFTTDIFNPSVSFTNLSINASTWNWNFGDYYNTSANSSSTENPTHIYSKEGTYCVMLTVANSVCVDTTTHCIIIEGNFTFYIPNAFTPNGDGENDEFFGKGENITAFEMSIYDRWGNQLFYGDNINKHWDGVYKGNVVQEDVYVYIVNLKDNHGESHKYVGSVTVVK